MMIHLKSKLRSIVVFDGNRSNMYSQFDLLLKVVAVAVSDASDFAFVVDNSVKRMIAMIVVASKKACLRCEHLTTTKTKGKFCRY
mmetsp:Transcript_35996/g.38997  ORF Transcript_35996/g.38997 Transcript_35996/m.38997 type:complete len:85 (-) Transcript_35996:78-332(-)